MLGFPASPSCEASPLTRFCGMYWTSQCACEGSPINWLNTNLLLNECLQIAISYPKVCIKHILVVLVVDTSEMHGEHFLGFSSSLLLSVCEIVHFKSCLLISGL